MTVGIHKVNEAIVCANIEARLYKACFKGHKQNHLVGVGIYEAEQQMIRLGREVKARRQRDLPAGCMDFRCR